VRRDGRDLISFSGNDYLGLSQHPAVLAAAREALERNGAGAGASRLVTGDHPLYGELEALLAEMKGTEAACVFGSGYLANIGIIPALADAGDLILADRLAHACMLDGARLSGASLMRFAHNSLEHCEALLKAHRADYANCLILTETVFSMDGDRAPVSRLAQLAAQYDAWLMTDDAHGLGVIHDTLPDAKATLQMGTLSKAAGSYGGYVCASRAVIDLLKTSARSLMFSTALPPPVLAASIVALKIIRDDAQLTRRPLEKARLFTRLLARDPAPSAIIPVILGEVERALEASAMLEEHGYLAACIRPPTVPPGTARLRFAFSAQHEDTHIEEVAGLLTRHGYA
jgi:8-amino-7-oxononanoate synthase